MKPTRALIALSLLAVLLAACAPAAGLAGRAAEAAAPASQAEQAACPVTQAPSPAFAPPDPWPAAHPYGGFWYGSENLWTALDADGTWSGLPAGGDGSIGEKVFWWNKNYDYKTEQQPALTVTARRLDGDPNAAPETVTASPATNGFHDDLRSFMLVGLNLPSAGCWEVTGEYGGERLSFVVLVES